MFGDPSPVVGPPLSVYTHSLRPFHRARMRKRTKLTGPNSKLEITTAGLLAASTSQHISAWYASGCAGSLEKGRGYSTAAEFDRQQFRGVYMIDFELGSLERESRQAQSFRWLSTLKPTRAGSPFPLP